MLDRMRGQVHDVKVSMDLLERALVVHEVTASAISAHSVLQVSLAVLTLILMPVHFEPLLGFVEQVVSLELLVAMRE